jgi:heme-degrading monooxygenase HmoA
MGNVVGVSDPLEGGTMTDATREPKIGLFFEVDPLPGHSDRYFDLAAALRPELAKNPGLIFIDRYKSIDRPNLVLSHSLWESEETLVAWRQHGQHRAIQKAGREQHFRDYRIRIGRVLAAGERTTPGRLACATYLDAEPRRHDGGELFKSVYRDGKFLILSDTPREAEAGAESRLFDVIRDYTMYDRTEAPQHYPPVERRVAGGA